MTYFAPEYHRAIGAIATVVDNLFREPHHDAIEEGQQPVPLDPHELRAAIAATIALLQALHGIVAGTADHIRLAAHDECGTWQVADHDVDRDTLRRANDPSEFRPRPADPVTIGQILAGWRRCAIADVELPARRLGNQLAEAITTADDVLDTLRALTSAEHYDTSTGLPASTFCGHDGWWSYRRHASDLGYRVDLVEQVPGDRLGTRARPVEPPTTELDDPEPAAFTDSLLLDDPGDLPDPAVYGWIPDPTRTRPAGAARPTVEDGLYQHWTSPDGCHCLAMYRVSDDRVNVVRYDNQHLPLVLDLLTLVITGGGHV